MVRSITEIQSNTDRVLGEIRSMLVDLCLRSGITEIDGRQLSREDSHIFFHQKDEMDSAQMCSVGGIEERVADNKEVNFMPEQLTDSSYCREPSLPSYQNLNNANYQNPTGNSSGISANIELEGKDEDTEVQVSELVTNYQELKVFDKLSERDKDENGGETLVEGVIGYYASELFEKGESEMFDQMPDKSELKVFDKILERSLVKKGMEWKMDESSFFGPLCGEKYLDITIDDEEGMGSLQDPPIGKLHVKLEGLRNLGIVCGLGEPNEVEKPRWLQFFEAAPNLKKFQGLKKMLDQDMTKSGTCTTHGSPRKNAKIEDDEGSVWLCLEVQKLPQLPLPPPEPPPQQIIAHSNLWSLRTRTISRGGYLLCAKTIPHSLGNYKKRQFLVILFSTFLLVRVCCFTFFDRE